MLYKEIIAVCFQIHTKHINRLCGQNVELLNVKLVVHRVTTELYCASTSLEVAAGNVFVRGKLSYEEICAFCQ